MRQRTLLGLAVLVLFPVLLALILHANFGKGTQTVYDDSARPDTATFSVRTTNHDMTLRIFQKAIARQYSGVETTVVFGGLGVQLFTKRLPHAHQLDSSSPSAMSPAQTIAYERGLELQRALKALNDSGVRVVVCPHCMKIFGVLPSDLPDEAQCVETPLMRRFHSITSYPR